MKKIFALFFCFLISFTAFAQIIFLPSIDVFSILKLKKEKPYVVPFFDATFNLNIQAFPQAYFDTSFTIVLDNPADFFNLNKKKRTAIQAYFLNSALSFPTIANKNIYFALFYGQYDFLNSDKILRETAKVKMESPDFQKYYPTSVFKPDLKVEGLGFSLYGSLNPLPAYFASYVYWNGDYSKESFSISADFRTGYSFSSGAINVFFGSLFCKNIKETKFRAGVTASLTVDNIYEFYFDVGVDKIGIKEKEAYKKLYALFEPRIVYDAFYFSIPFFMAPVSSLAKYMDNSQYEDSSFAGLGLKLAGGNLEKYNFEVGLSMLTSINPQEPSKLTAFTFLVSPFFTYAFSNYDLSCRLNLRPLYYNDISKLINLSIEFKAVR